MSQVGFSEAGDSNQPSPSIWGDCPKTILNDKGLGFYAHEDFLGGPVTASLTDGLYVSPVLTADNDTAALSYKTGEVGGYASFATGATDNDALALVSAPLGKLQVGRRLWFETRFEFAALGDEAVFAGVVEEAGASRDVVADNPSNAAQAALIGESLVGFVTQQSGSAVAKVDAVYKKDAGAVVTVKADATNATAIDSDDRANLAATTEVKLGFRYDGRDKLHFYVNGVRVASQVVDATVDISKDMAAIFAVKSGSASAKTVSVDWIRYAYQSRT